jgi:hypothetical protein
MAQAALKSGPKLKQARESHTAIRLADGRVLIMGGAVPFVGTCAMACIQPDTESVEVYDPNADKFTDDGSLAGARVGAQALLLGDGTVLLEGGGYGAIVETPMEIFNPATGKSTLVKLPSNLKDLLSEAAVSLLADGRVLIAGGSYDNGQTASKLTMIFDPASGAFSNGPTMAKDRQGAEATLLDDGRVLVVGGQSSTDPRDGLEVIDVAHPLSQPLSLDLQGYASSSTLLSDGRVLVAEYGQYDSVAGCTPPAAWEIFDPKSGKLSPAGPLTTPRTGAVAVKSQDGRVLVFGGVDSKCAAVGTIEALDPGSGKFQVIAAGFPAISEFTATVLDDGQILIAGGGTNGWSGETAATWLFKP